MPYEPSQHDLRASDADREVTVERLRVAGMEGRLDSEELEQRIETAYASRWCSELEALTLDVTPPPVRIDRAKPVFVRPKQRVNALAVASVVVSLFWIVGSIAAVIMGHVALRQIAQSGGAQIGRAAALTGLAFGYFGLTVLLAAILFSAA